MKFTPISFKSIALVLIASAAVTPLFSQDLTNKDGIPILPQAKEWSLGLDATRLIQDVDFNFVSTSQAITGKYMINAQTAYRMSLRLGFNNHTSIQMTTDRVAASSSVIAYPSAVVMKENVWKKNTTAFGIGFGIEKRRGISRLQGIYGIEGNIYILSNTDNFTYGNALVASATSPILVDATGDAMTSPKFGSANNIDSLPPIQGVTGFARVITRKSGLGFSVGARLFIGAEYFLLPKMSLGGEFGYSLAYASSGRTETELESIGQSNVPGAGGESVKRTTYDSGKTNSFGFDTDNANSLSGLSASLRLNLYF
jgi:hypothetical protein